MSDSWSAEDRRKAFQKKNKSVNEPLLEESDAGSSHGIDFFPIVLALFQILWLVLFSVFGVYPSLDTSHDLALYPYFKDVAVMVLVGFGFLTAFLRRHRFGSLTYVLLITIVCFQLALLVNAFFFSFLEGNHVLLIDINAVLSAFFTAAAVLITFGVLIGKINGTQLFALVVPEVIFQALNNWIVVNKIGAVDFGGSIVIHMFGAYFGMGATVFLSVNVEERSKYASSSYTSDTFSLLATFFLWVFWPSFNAATAPTSAAKIWSVVNTLLALSSSSVTTLVCSRLMRKSRFWTLEDIQNATLAGGVAVGSSAAFLTNPGGAVGIGMIAGAISVLGYAVIAPFFASRFRLHDTAGVHNLHGMPSIIGGVASAIVLGANGSGVWWKQLAGTGVTLGIAILSGLVTGFIISRTIRAPRLLFDDKDAFHLSVLCEHAGDGCDKPGCGDEGRIDPRTTLTNLHHYMSQHPSLLNRN